MPLSAEDRIELHELMARYANAVDVDGVEADVFEVFTDDALLDSPLSGNFSGTEGLRQFAKVVAGLRVGKIGRHLITNVRISEASEGARIQAYYLHASTPAPSVEAGKRSTQVTHTGRYECIAVKCDGRWRLKKRTVIIDSA